MTLRAELERKFDLKIGSFKIFLTRFIRKKNSEPDPESDRMFYGSWSGGRLCCRSHRLGQKRKRIVWNMPGSSQNAKGEE